MFNTKSLAVCGMLALCATSATAGSWSLDPSVSNISFGSIKNDYIGESHSFRDISGSVNHDGVVKINVGLGSVQTNIDIRDERMVEHVFASAPDATITAAIDMSAMEKLEVGSSKTMETTGQLAFLGQEMELDAKLFVMRLSEDKVMVTTDGMVMLSTEDAGIDQGIDKLQELASLDSITRVSPVSLRLIFETEG